MNDSSEQLRTRWENLWRRVGAASVPAIADLLKSYTEPQRTYHNLRHIQQCLAELDVVRDACTRPDEVELAIWYHDVIYDAKRPDNEEQSAQQAAAAMRNASIDSHIIENITTLIVATKHASPPAPGDAQILADIDLSILGRPPAEFDAYEHAIRQEYSYVDDASFRAGRSAILQKFLSRDVIYATEILRNKYEAVARAHLRRSIDCLTAPTP